MNIIATARFTDGRRVCPVGVPESHWGQQPNQHNMSRQEATSGLTAPNYYCHKKKCTVFGQLGMVRPLCRCQARVICRFTLVCPLPPPNIRCMEICHSSSCREWISPCIQFHTRLPHLSNLPCNHQHFLQLGHKKNLKAFQRCQVEVQDHVSCRQ